jgi:hypothetical protein
VSTASDIAAELHTPTGRPCIAERFLTTLDDDARAEFDNGIDDGIPVDRARKVARRRGYTGNASSWHKHYAADCCCPATPERSTATQ